MNKINVTRSSMPSLDEYVEEIKELWDSHWLTNNGIKHKELQEKLEEKLNVKNIVLYTNGHLALEAAWEYFDFPIGSEVITTPFTFASTVNAIYRSGLIPVFCDVMEEDYTINPSLLEGLITDKTVAICPVHVYGNICDVEKIEHIAKKHNLKVVYDAAHAFNVCYKGKSIANYGDFAMFSFHATKVFNTIEGGALAFNDNSCIEKLNECKNFGIHSENEIPYSGGNAKMNEFQAAMGLCNLRHVDFEILKRKKVYEHYMKRLNGLEGIKLPYIQKDVEPNYAYFPVIFYGYKYNRDELFLLLQENGIVSRKYFYPLINAFDCYKNLKYNTENKTPIAKYLSDNVLCLPMYADLSIEDVDRICDIILK